MVKLRIFLLVGLCMLFFTSFSQKRYSKSLTQLYGKGNKPAHFKNNKKMKVICPGFTPSEYPYQGIGIKIGDPFAITYKLYATKWFAFSMDGGFASSGLYKSRYKALFATFPEADTLTYVNHQVNKDVVFAVNVSFYNEGPKFLKGLDYYLSLGWQFRYVDLLYGFVDEVSVTEKVFGTFNKSTDYMGPEIGIGLEYSYFNLPISAFLEVNWMYDIVYEPTFIKFQGGIGLRYVF